VGYASQGCFSLSLAAATRMPSGATPDPTGPAALLRHAFSCLPPQPHRDFTRLTRLYAAPGRPCWQPWLPGHLRRTIVDTTKAFACSCAGISTNRALRESDAVPFEGTVVSKESRRNVATPPRTDISLSRSIGCTRRAVYSETSCGVPDMTRTPVVWIQTSAAPGVIFATEGIEGEGDRAVGPTHHHVVQWQPAKPASRL
jgi:hypothetical protein